MPKYRECSVDEFLSKREMTTSNGIAYRAAAIPKTFNAEERSAVVVMTDETVDSYGDIVKAAGADLYRFDKNPIALFNHRSDLPIGTWSEVTKKPNRVEGKVKIAAQGSSPTSDMAFNMMSQGILRAASIGFMPTKLEMRLDDDGEPMWCYLIHEWELYECSIVSIPANPSALARSAGDSDELRIARDYIEQVLDSFVKTPEGLLIPRSEYEKAYKVVVEKIAEDTRAPILLRAAGKDIEVKTPAVIALPLQDLSDETVAELRGAAHPESKVSLIHRETDGWVLEFVDNDHMPRERVLPTGTGRTAAEEFGAKLFAAPPADHAADAVEMQAFKAFLVDNVKAGDAVYTYHKLLAATPTASMTIEKGVTVQHEGSDKIDKFEFADGMTQAHKDVLNTHFLSVANESETPAENKTETNAAPIVVTLEADTSQIEAAAAKVEGIFEKLAKKFPMFFPKAIEERIEPTMADPEPPAPPTADEIAAARARAAAVRERLVSKNLIAA